MKPVKIGLLGAGDVSLLHADAIAQCYGAELKGLWNRSPKPAEEKSHLFGCKNYSSPEELVKDDGIDAVFVLTNLETHHKFVMMALEAGKHVLVEKPVGVSVKEIEDMKQAAEKAGVVCMPVHNYIYEDALNRTKDLIVRDKLGKLTSIYVMYNIHHPEEVAARYPGVIRQILTHHSYILLYLAGQPEALSAMKATLHYDKIPQEDIAMVNLRMKSGALAHLCASFAADDNSTDSWTVAVKVIGTKGSTNYSYRDWIENEKAVVHCHTFSAYNYTFINTVHHFVEGCLRREEAPLSTLDDAITAQKMIEACELSVQERKEIAIL